MTTKTGNDRRHVLIIGGGIGGMTSALALLQAGFKVTVFEQSDELREVGAGLSIQPSATRAIDSLGLGEELRRISDVSHNLAATHYKTGEPITPYTGLKIVDDSGTSWHHHLHRADFQKMLENAVRAASPDTIVLSHRLKDVEQSADGVTAGFENGNSASGDILIAADGVRSVVRAKLFSESPPRFRGQVAYRFLIPLADVQDVIGDRPPGSCIGPGRIFTRYRIRHKTVLNCVGIVRTDTWQDEGWFTPATREELVAQYEGWHESIVGLMRRAPEETLIKWALYDREPLPSWTVGRIALLGDAAHPILPFLGMGGAMAIEDAIVLARACAASPDDLPLALQKYQTVRQPRTTHVLMSSRAQGDAYQSDDTDSYASKPRPQADPALYGYDPTTVPI